MPEVKKAELIEGIVYMGSPVRSVYHGEPHLIVSGWITHYMAKTPGVRGGDNSTVRLDDDNEPQPDLLLRVESTVGGKSRIDEDGYLSGPVELAIEIASSSVSIDTHIKKDAYRKLGIAEYLVYRVLDGAVNWFTLQNGQYVELPPDEKGVIRSGLFPGLWLSPADLVSGNLGALFALIDQGISSPEHQAFRNRLESGK